MSWISRSKNTNNSYNIDDARSKNRLRGLWGWSSNTTSSYTDSVSGYSTTYNSQFTTYGGTTPTATSTDFTSSTHPTTHR